MANPNDPNGFKPVRGVGGSACFRTNRYFVSSAYTAIIGVGAMVQRADGYVKVVVAEPTEVLGVSAEYLASSTGGWISVYDEPTQWFEVQVDDNTDTTELGYVGNCFKMLGTNASNSTTLHSKQQLDGSSAAAYAASITFLHSMGISKKIGNDAATSWTRLHVMVAPVVNIHANQTPTESAL